MNPLYKVNLSNKKIPRISTQTPLKSIKILYTRYIFIPSLSISNKKCNKHFNCEKKNQSKYLQAIDNRFAKSKLPR